MSFSRSAMVAALLFSVFFVVSVQAAAALGTVRAPGGVPLAGKVVDAYDAGGVLRATTKTIANGTYVLTFETTGQYRLLAYDPEGVYATSVYPDAESFDVAPFVTISDLGPNRYDFNLVVGGSISGAITAANAPLANAVVEIYNLSGTRRGFTSANAAGEFALVVPPGNYKLFAYDSNGVYAGEFYSNGKTFAEATVVHAIAGGAPPVAIALERGSRVSGTAIDAVTRQPIAGLTVYTYTADGTLVATKKTDAQGAFSFTLPGGQYRIVAVDGALLYGPAYWNEADSFSRAEILTLVAGVDRMALNLLVERSAVIQGRVSNFSTEVVAYNLDGTVHATAGTDSFGHYRLLVAPGQYKIGAIPVVTWAPQFYPNVPDFDSAQTVTVLSGQFLTIDFNPPRGGQVSGTVRDATSNQPLAGMAVAAYDARGAKVGETTSGANGTYTLLVAPGDYRIVAFDSRLDYATSYGPPTTSVAVDANVTLDFSMRRGTRVSGIVMLANGRPAEGVEVLALDAGGNVVAGARTAADGTFTLTVAPGTYSFVARTQFASATAGPVVVGATSPGPVSFVLDGVGRRRTARA